MTSLLSAFFFCTKLSRRKWAGAGQVSEQLLDRSSLSPSHTFLFLFHPDLLGALQVWDLISGLMSLPEERFNALMLAKKLQNQPEHLHKARISVPESFSQEVNLSRRFKLPQVSNLVVFVYTPLCTGTWGCLSQCCITVCWGGVWLVPSCLFSTKTWWFLRSLFFFFPEMRNSQTQWFIILAKPLPCPVRRFFLRKHTLIYSGMTF